MYHGRPCTGVARIFVGGGGGTRPTPPSLASAVHKFEAVAGSRGSVSAPVQQSAESWVEPQSEIKIAKKYR